MENVPTGADLDALRRGVMLKDGPTRPARVRLLARFTAVVATRSTGTLSRQHPDPVVGDPIDEGRNRQVRRMTAAIGYPTLRLVRYAVGDWTLGEIAPGEWRRVDVPAPTVRRNHRPAQRPRRRPGRSR